MPERKPFFYGCLPLLIQYKMSEGIRVTRSCKCDVFQQFLDLEKIGSMILGAVKLRAWFHPGHNLKPVRIVRHCREPKVSPLLVGFPQIQPQSFKKGLFTCKCSLLQILPPIFLELPWYLFVFCICAPVAKFSANHF